MPRPSSWPFAARHGTVFGITCVAVLLSVGLAIFVEPSYYLPLTAAVALCTWLFGRTEGLHATVAGAVLADFILISPRYSFGMRRHGVTGLLLFILVALLVVFLTSSLRSSRDLQKSILESMSDALIVTDRRGLITYLNPAAEALVGYSAEEARRAEFDAIFRLTDETTRAGRSGVVQKVLASASPAQSGGHTILTARDGTEYSVEENAAPVRASDNRITGSIVVLRNTTRRRQVQDQLTQSQKMEAIGRLAGGVAGDFNQLLTVITGYSELLTSEMAAGNPLRHFAQEILLAAERAAELTRQLLWFGKGQFMAAKPHNVNVLVEKMQTMLQRVLGSGVELVLLPAQGVARINTDPGQIEQIMVNLAMNSRDAMPNGGKFVVGISNVELSTDLPDGLPDMKAGQYVMLNVSDTGTGMDAETRARLFEPFFTTKNQGKGSGLGLSIVYGIVQQHGGHISVYSQVGAGTIFEIYIPRAKEAPPPPVPAARPRGTETILIADDEDAVRKLVNAVLVNSGYTVYAARNAREALDLFQTHRDKIDMVLTDVVMPHMTGYELGKQIEEIAPGKKILFMSGYRDSHMDDGDAGRALLNKPFTPDVLLKHVRATLDGTGTV